MYNVYTVVVIELAVAAFSQKKSLRLEDSGLL